MDSVWDELAEGVFRRRYDSFDLNVGVVIGEDGVLVVDTRASHVEVEHLLDELGHLTPLPAKWVVNTHWHFEHTFGNATFEGAVIHGHVRCRLRLLAEGSNAKRDALAWVDEAQRADVEAVEISPPTEVFERGTAIDLGNRSVAMTYLGRGHTDNDIVVTISDVPVLFAGDLFEEGAPPYFGDGYPIAWADTAAAVSAIGASLSVPGHGDVMSASAVEEQCEELHDVARRCVEGLASGEFDADRGPYPADTMRTAWERARLEIGAPGPQ